MAYRNFGEIISDLQGLSRTVEAIRQNVVLKSGIAYTSQDIRQCALDGIQRDLAACSLWMRSLMGLKNLVQSKQKGKFEENYRQILGTGLPSGLAEDIMLDHLRNTLPVQIQFRMEALFRGLLEILSAHMLEPTFMKAVVALLQQVGLHGTEHHVFAILANLTEMRRTNGVHVGESLSVTTDGVDFNFHQGSRVECGSWWHIMVALRANISTLGLVLSAPRIVGLNREILEVGQGATTPVAMPLSALKH